LGKTFSENKLLAPFGGSRYVAVVLLRLAELIPGNVQGFARFPMLLKLDTHPKRV
jgi:hypothetical protein